MRRRKQNGPVELEEPLEGAEELNTQDSDMPKELDDSASLIEALQKQVKEEHDLYLRTLADFQNYRRRQEDESRQLRQFANRELILALLPVLDNFERALTAAEQNQNYDALVGGVALTLRQMQDFLKKNGVHHIEAVGQEFDPNFHEAVMRVEDSDHPDNTVVEEVQRGYAMHDRVLRPAMVKVSARP